MASQNHMLDSELMLKKECEETWKHVNRNHAVLISQPKHGPIGDTPNTLSTISQMKAKCLQGEIDGVKTKPVQVLPNDPVILESLLKGDLEKNVSQLEECLSVIEGRRKELEDDLARQKELLSQHQDMNQALESRLRQTEEGGNKSKPTEDSQIKTLKRKQKTAGEIQNVLLKQIGDFVGTHFPLPDSSKNKQSSQVKYISLLEIIELLMNKGMDGDTDPYISIHDAFWPPYIELLLRCDIASRHPQDASRIRLVDFERCIMQLADNWGGKICTVEPHDKEH